MDGNQSVVSGVTDVTGWGGPMGGGPGDGIPPQQGQRQQQQMPPPPPSTVYTTPALGGLHQQLASQPQMQAQMQPAMMGSVTRFAPPVVSQQQPMYSSPSHGGPQPSSYAARSQQMYGTSTPPPLPHQQQQSQTPTMNSNSLVARSQQAYGGPSAIPGSQMMPQQQYQQQSQQQQQYSQQYQQPPQPQQRPLPASTPSNVYGGPSTMATGNAYSSSTMATPGSFAARSQQAYGSPPPQQIAPATAASVANHNDTYSAASFAARSHQAYGPPQSTQQPPTTAATARLANTTLYGYNNPQQQQQQQAMLLNSPPQGAPPVVGLESTQQQQRLLNDATRKVQEHAYYMKQAIEQQNLSLALDRAAHMVGELGGPPHGQHVVSSNTGNAAKLTPKSYYELYMRALEEMPTFQEYLMALVVVAPPAPGPGMMPPPYPSSGGMQQNTGMYGNVNAMSNNNNNNPGMMMMMPNDPLLPAPGMPQNPGMYPGMSNPGMPGVVGMPAAPMTNTMNRYMEPMGATAAGSVPTSRSMRQLYDTVQFYPRVVSRLYLQIAAGSALIQSGECGANWVMTELQQAVKCEQNPVRGLFVRNFLLTALRDKLPDTAPAEEVLPVADHQVDEAASHEDDDSAGDERGHAVTKSIKVVDEQDKGTVRDSVAFIMSNFMEMNKLWVRIQHLPGEGRNKDVRKRRERERNDLRLLIGNNLMRLSQLECVTSKMYGEMILPKILDHIVVAGDPLSQAYTLDCLVQVFPDEYHIETLPILLSVCPRLRDKVNIRTILQGLMDRLANYLLEEELLDESDTNQVKKEIARDAFGLFEDCVQKVFNARGPKLSSKEVIRLQTALLQFSIKCYPGNIEQVSNCINNCVSALRQANASYEVTSEGTVATNVPAMIRPLDLVSTWELGELLSIPLDSFALRVLELEQYGALISFLPWANQRQVATSMLKAVEKNDSPPQSVHEIDQLFRVVGCLVSDEQNGARPPYGYHSAPGHIVDLETVSQENKLISKLIHQLHHDSTDVLYEMLQVAKARILNERAGPHRWSKTLVAIVYAGLRLGQRVARQRIENKPAQSVVEGTADEEKAAVDAADEEKAAVEEGVDEIGSNVDESPSKQAADVGEENIHQPSGNGIADEKEPELISDDAQTSLTTSRTIFAFVQETIVKIGEVDKEVSVKLFLDASLAVDSCILANPEKEKDDCGPVVIEFLNQSCDSFENNTFNPDAQVRCIYAIAGALQVLSSIDGTIYESVTTKVAQFAARVIEKPQQCRLIAVCAHLFYPVKAGLLEKYSSAQHSLECLQRCLKLADACTTLNSSHVTLFVDLLENYLCFFEAKNPLVTDGYITGLLALIKEHLNSAGAIGNTPREAKTHFVALVEYIKDRKNDPLSADLFAPVVIGE